MRVNVVRHPGFWTLKCQWSTSGLLPGPIPEVISAVKSGVRSIIINLGDVDYINTIGVKAILDSIKFASTYNTALTLCEPSPFVRRALKMNGLDGHVPIYNSELKARSYAEKTQMGIELAPDFHDRILIGQNTIRIARDIRIACKKHPLKPKFRLLPVRRLKTAIEMLHCDHLDCVLLDSSFIYDQVTQLIDDIHCSENCQEIPIIIVADENGLERADEMVRHGATDIIRHPFRPVDAITRIHTLISFNKDRNTFIPPDQVIQPWGTR